VIIIKICTDIPKQNSMKTKIYFRTSSVLLSFILIFWIQELNAQCLLSVTVPTMNFAGVGGTQNTDVNKNDRACTYSISSSSSWITATQIAGGNAIRVVTTNNTGMARSGTVRVSGGGVIINVYQACGNPGYVGDISGTSSVCQGQTNVNYNVPVISGATGYTWTLPTGVSISAGTNTNSITVNYASNALSGNIVVMGTNTCGNGTVSSPFAVNVNSTPATAGSISGSSVVRQGLTGVTYSVPAISGATGYTWTLPSGASITSGANTNNITIAFALNASSGNITVKGTNSCGNGTVSDSYSVTITEYTSGLNYNYIKETKVLEEDKTDISLLTSLPVEKKNISTTFFDGLGRPMQTVNWKASPKYQDIIQPIVYDEYGRETTKYLPYVDGGNDGNYRSNELLQREQEDYYETSSQFKFYQSGNAMHPDNVASDLKPSSFSFLDRSPLNRVLQEGAPGTTWQALSGHAIKFDYQTNTTQEVLIFEVNNSNIITNIGGDLIGSKYYYKVNELFKAIIKDENWVPGDGNLHTTEEFKDKQGQVVLKRSYVKNDLGSVVAIETYYVYDDFGLLRYVIPPKALASITFPADRNNTVIKSLCYYYEYDSRKRMIIKQLPGAEAVYMVYDKRDRLVATQDGNLRNHKNAANQPDPLWMFTKYDCFNRPVITGTFTPLQTNRNDLQTAVDSFYAPSEILLYTERGDVATYPTGYKTGQSYPENITETDLLTITYYDNYDNIPNVSGFTAVKDLGVTVNNSKVLGQVTATRTKILDNGNAWITTTNYYDDKYRLIQTAKNNYIQGEDRLTSKYDFVGKLEKTRLVHTGISPKTIDKGYKYDHAGRLIKIYHSIGGATPILMSYMVYNELGQLVDKKIHSSDQGVNYLQSIDYRYNIRGWLTKINGPETVGMVHPNEGNVIVKPDVFGMEIKYNDPFNQ
jgi:hypothetical protein